MSMRQKRLRCRLDSVNDRGADNRRVGNNDRAMTSCEFIRQPLAHPLYDGGNRFATVWRGRRIVQPGRGDVRFVSVHFVESSPRSSAVVAVAQHGLDLRIESESLGRLSCPQLRARPESVHLG